MRDFVVEDALETTLPIRRLTRVSRLTDAGPSAGMRKGAAIAVGATGAVGLIATAPMLAPIGLVALAALGVLATVRG